MVLQTSLIGSLGMSLPYGLWFSVGLDDFMVAWHRAGLSPSADPEVPVDRHMEIGLAGRDIHIHQVSERRSALGMIDSYLWGCR